MATDRTDPHDAFAASKVGGMPPDNVLLGSPNPTNEPSPEESRIGMKEKQEIWKQIWAKALDIDPAKIEEHHSFFELGGDSFGAMDIVSAAREKKMYTTVEQIFRYPRLCDIATIDHGQAQSPITKVQKLSLLGDNPDTEQIRAQVATNCKVGVEKISDIYPCSPLQEGLLSLTLKRPGDYTLQCVQELHANVDQTLFQAAWEHVARSIPTLRTRIVQTDQLGLLQTVIEEDITWAYSEHMEDYLKEDRANPIELGRSLTRYALVREPNNAKVWFVWTLHHAVYDGWTLPRIKEAVNRTYRGQMLKAQPSFNLFIRYIKNQDSELAAAYWQAQLSGCEAALFPHLPAGVQPVANTVIEHSFSPRQCSFANTTMPTLIRAAWAIVCSRYTNCNDVIFGATVTGRNAPVSGIEAILGPTIATVPIRVHVPKKASISSFLGFLQTQMIEMIPYEQTGLLSIAKLGADAHYACMFQTLLVIQPADRTTTERDDLLGVWDRRSRIQDFMTYGLTLDCVLHPDGGVKITANFDSKVLETWQATKMLAQLSSVMGQISDAEMNTTIEDVNTLTLNDQQQIWAWNRDLPPSTNQCVHEIFAETVIKQPEAAAICAWDREITYRELDILSSKLACYLVSIGMKSKDIVPLHFEKSALVAVTIIAVVKAGGAFLMLDPNLPIHRLSNMVDQVKPSFILTSVRNEISTKELHQNTVVITESLLEELKDELPDSQIARDDSSLLYVTFTSGSTGKPKGVMITHRNLATAVHYQSKVMDFTSKSRVFDFASYSFDTSIENLFSTVLAGGCLCVPNDNDRKDNMVYSIKTLRANTLELTPSVAKLLHPEDLSIDTIIFGGEALHVADVLPWWGKARIINTYGPSECTPTSTVNSDDSRPDALIRLGRGIGLVTWVADAEDHNKLLPIGAIGELLLEGPLVGPGYINHPHLTDTVFVKAPKWLSEGSSFHSGRDSVLYKTGDLVQYDADGNLSFLGRKDNQIKIRGQRVELSEIEHHVRDCLPTAKQIAVEIVDLAGENGSNVIAVFVRLDKGPFPKDTNSAHPFFPAEVDNRLVERLPVYMMPQAYFAVNELPMTTSGKTDRRRLREIVASFSIQHLTEQGVQGKVVKRQPSTDIEVSLQRLWAQILNIEPENIGMDDSFFRLGGDSITAMQISSSGRSQGMSISSQDILKKKTIAAIAYDISPTSSTSTMDKEELSIERNYRLSPIQELYLRLEPSGEIPFHQSFYLKLTRFVDIQSIRNAIHEIIQRHPMLRARFARDVRGLWHQYVTRQVDESFILDLIHLDEMETAIMDMQNQLDIRNGPLICAAIADDKESQLLFMTIHHLVVDLVSWRVILGELESLLSGGKLSPMLSTDFPVWCDLQARHTVDLIEKNPLLHSIKRNKPQERHLSYWGENASSSLFSDLDVEQFVLDELATSSLFGDCHEIIHTTPLELMLAGLMYSFANVFRDRSLPTVYSETHGREPWNTDIDISRTIGWFTSMFPVDICCNNNSKIVDFVRQTKDSVRQYGDKGRANFASYFKDEMSIEDFVSDFPVEIIFNYHGFYQQLERNDTLFKRLDVPECGKTNTESQSLRLALFEVSMAIKDNRAHASITYDSSLQHQVKIKEWMKQYKNVLQHMPSELSKESPRWSLSDFPLSFCSYNDLDRFRNETLVGLGVRPNDVEDIFPCSSIQEGMLISQSKDKEAYWTCSIYEAVAKKGTMINVVRLQEAWKAVVRRHALLRATFVNDVPGTIGVTHLVLKDPQPSIAVFETKEESIIPTRFRKRYWSEIQQAMGLQHHLSIFQTKLGKVFLAFDINHAIIDAHSQEVLIHDLRMAYNSAPDIRATSFGAIVPFLRQEPRDEEKNYWGKYLEDAQPCLFPSLADTTDEIERNGFIRVANLDVGPFREFCKAQEIAPAAVIQTAWALVLRAYTGLQAPCFGNLSSRRELQVHGIEGILGPLITMLPCHVRLQGRRTTLDVLHSVQSDNIVALQNQNFSLAAVHKLLGLGSSALFNTSISCKRIHESKECDEDPITFIKCPGLDPTEYDIAVNATYSERALGITVNFQKSCINNHQATQLGDNLACAINSIVADPQKQVSEQNILSRDELRRIWSWNQAIPLKVDRCIHDVFTENANAHPGSPAICAWDGELTYNQLENLSKCLSHHLKSVGVQRHDIVLLYFEKSVYSVVAMLAVLMAGGTFASLDPTHPATRHEKIFESTGAKFIITSAKYSNVRVTNGQTVIPVSESSMKRLIHLSGKLHKACLDTKPSDPAYVIFTSGSTGVPKGVVLDHDAAVTSCLSHGKVLGFHASTRVLQFSSYGFDACIAEIFTTLFFSGCICIPSDAERYDNLSSYINNARVNWAFLTPAVARMLDPELVPTLKTLAIGGEKLHPRDWLQWKDRLQAIQVYGPTECCIYCTACVEMEGRHASTIGKAIGSVSWVVDPQDHNKLAILGSVGELLIEGPILARGYLNDDAKEAAAFIHDPPWLLKGGPKWPGRRGKLYKTHDLVRYTSDGNLVYVGRKDNQVKIHGQRVELGEIEYHVRHCLSTAQQVAVEIIEPEANHEKAMVAAFIQEKDTALQNENQDSLARPFFPDGAHDQMSQRIPAYMLPGVYFKMTKMPLTASGKTDRRRLREIGASFSIGKLTMTENQKLGRPPKSEQEWLLRDIWAEILGIEAYKIGMGDDFFRLGGDSIAAMKLVAQARKQNIQLTVAAIFHNPILECLARLGNRNALDKFTEVAAFSLLKPHLHGKVIQGEVAACCRINVDMLEDIYPCSPLQEGLISLTSKRPGDYILQRTMDLQDDTDEEAFRAAWDQTVQLLSVFRTRIVHHQKLGLVQAVVNERIFWDQGTDLDAYLSKDRSMSMKLGDRLVRFAIIKNQRKRWFVWTIHHALYDGWSLSLVTDTMNKIYMGHAVTKPPGFNAFIGYLEQLDKAKAVRYWQTTLAGCEATPFPCSTSLLQEPESSAVLEYDCPLLPKISSGTTTSSLIRAAWAIVASQFTNSNDIIFGTTITGRNAPVIQIEDIIGPTIATVPVRVQIPPGCTVSQLLDAIQQQATEMIPFEQTGLHRISRMGQDAQHACNFQTLLVVQPADEQLTDDTELGVWKRSQELQSFTTYALTIICVLKKDNVHVTASFDPKILSHFQLECMLRQFGFAMQELAGAENDMTIDCIKTPTPEDIRELWVRNADLPPSVEECVHQIFSKRMRQHPDAPAVCAWDCDVPYEDVSYGELEDLSTQLAGKIIGLGVKPTDSVLLCFEKSMWITVAILAVLKAGAWFVPLDPDHPPNRQREIAAQTGARLVLTSAGCKYVAGDETVIAVSKQIFNQPHMSQGVAFPLVRPDFVAYTIFTSGSTGTPKGVVVEHRTASTSCLYHGKTFKFTKETRTLQFSSYAWDICIAEIVTTLMFGGCICIPSESDRRNNLARTMDRMGVTHAIMTPTVSRLLDRPSTSASLQTLILGGETATSIDVNRWEGYAEVIIGYGPAECCICCTASFGKPYQLGAIGQPVGSINWVVDPVNSDRLSAIGSIGELLIEGPILARGYLNNPSKTKEVFIEDPTWLVEGAGVEHPGRHGRLYKTGDLVRQGSDGNLIFIGRKDNQVKIRGQRVELEEIEYHVSRCMPTATRLAAEVIEPGNQKNKSLIAIFLETNEEDIHAQQMEVMNKDQTAKVIFPADVHAKLSDSLPGYMTPNVYFAICRIPTTSSGKTDRLQLRKIGASFSVQQLAMGKTGSAKPKRQPSNEAEWRLQHLCGRVLEMDPETIGMDDSFFQLGGDSIIAMKLVGEARRDRFSLTVADIFRLPRLVHLAAYLAALPSSTVTNIPKLLESGPVKQSYAQSRLWFLEHLYPGLDWYIIPWAFRIHGPLNLSALNASLNAIEERHETLRTTFYDEGNVGMQQVHPFQPKDHRVLDVSLQKKQTTEETIQSEQRRPFDLQKEPGWRISIYRLGQGNHILSIVMHHIISDGWSAGILGKELSAFYSSFLHDQQPAPSVPSLPIQYRDYAVWQRIQQAPIHEEQLAYWTSQLQSSQPAEIPCDIPRPSTLSGNAASQKLEISDSLYEKLNDFCKTQATTFFIVLLAVFRLTHYRLSGQTDAVIGTTNANRDRWELKDMVGFFVNMQCLRIKIQDESFFELISNVQQLVVDGLANQDVPFEQIVSQLQNDRDISRNPLAQILFTVHSQVDLGRLTLDGVQTEALHYSTTSRFDLEFHFFRKKSSLQGEIFFSTDLYKPETISNMLSVFHTVLEECLNNPASSVLIQDLMTENHYDTLDSLGLIQMNQAAYPRGSTIVEIFRQQVALLHSKVAVKDSRTSITYAELDKLSDQLSWWLWKQKLPNEAIVPIYAKRSCQTVIAFFGVLKANLAYLPLDTNASDFQIEATLSSINNRIMVLLGDNLKHPDLRVENVELVQLEDILRESGDQLLSPSQTLAITGPSPSSLAFMSFISGTGTRQKAVMVEHQSIARLVNDNEFASCFLSDGTMAHQSALTLDVASIEIYASLLNGVSLVCIDNVGTKDIEDLSTTFTAEDVKIAIFTPMLLEKLLSHNPPAKFGIDTLIVYGDRLREDVLKAQNFVTDRLIYVYGPPGSSVASTLHCVAENDQYPNGVPLGKAFNSSGVLVLDSENRMVPLGVIGELVLTGAGLTRGYTNPKRNQDSFRQTEIRGETLRAFRTGNMVRWRPTDGQLEIFGHRDGYARIGEHLVDLSDIEELLSDHPSIQDAVVLPQQSGNDGVTLAGFITIKRDDGDNGESTHDVEQNEHVDQWEEHFDSRTYAAVSDIQSQNVGHDFIGWTSMYDGTEIDKDEMGEWLQDTIDTILAGGEIGNVLEIGSGTGMILFNLGSDLKTYVGLDPSQAAVDYILRTSRTIPALAGKVSMFKCAAEHINKLKNLGDIDTVVINSVVQYFPSAEYLFALVQDLLKLQGVKRLFFGDVRSRSLNYELQATRALLMSGVDGMPANIKAIMNDMEDAELELLVDPSFFTELKDVLPHIVDHVEILPKRMKATNELTCFRYSAVIHLKKSGGERLQTNAIDERGWIDFSKESLDRDSLMKLLQSNPSHEMVAVSNIINRKTAFSRCLIDSLQETPGTFSNSSQWLFHILDKTANLSSLSTVEIAEIAKATGHDVEISWARQNTQRGGFDAIFYKRQSVTRGRRLFFQFPSDHNTQPGKDHSNNPVLLERQRKVTRDIHKLFTRELPPHMIPKKVTILESMPRKIDGSTDNAVLSQYLREIRHLVQTHDDKDLVETLPDHDLKRTEGYWQSVMAGCNATIFPSSPAVVQDFVLDETVQRTSMLPHDHRIGNISASIYSAWAIVASRHTDCQDTVFGITFPRQNCERPGIEDMFIPSLNTVPLRVQLSGDETILAFTQRIDQQLADMIPYRETYLPYIAQISTDTKHACDFQAVLRIQHEVNKETTPTNPQGLQYNPCHAFEIECVPKENKIQFTAQFDSRVIVPWQVENIIDQVSFVIQQILATDELMTVNDIDLMTPEHKQKILKWNANVPPAIDRCVHDLFSEQAKTQPGAQAVSAWDGKMTYSMLEQLSNRLSRYLQQCGITKEDVVILCFEKSIWMVVAMLSVLKAGGAFTTLDPTQPASRHKEIIKQTKTKLALTSSKYLHYHSTYWEYESLETFAVSKESLAQLPSGNDALRPNSDVNPNNAAYIMFTSGSTGIPKGVILEHKSVSTGCLAHGAAFGLSPGERVLQFTSYTFDPCITEIFTTMVYGGCVCIPSREDMFNDLQSCVKDMSVTCAHLTPSVARLLDPRAVPSLRTITLLGEQVTHADCARWGQEVHVINAYGPTECSVICAAYTDAKRFPTGCIGKGVASVLWVVDPNDYNRLSPMGSVGEMLVEGPLLARGYINDLAKTEAAFVSCPTWLVNQGRSGRLYKTGDLVKYEPNGDLTYMGRKDSQVKIRGQRVELGEIEYHVRQHMPEAKQVAVEMIQLEGEKEKEIMAVFVKGKTVVSEGDGASTHVFNPGNVDQKLRESLPDYMVPSVYFSVNDFPLSTAGKTDRKQLRKIGASFSGQQLANVPSQHRGPLHTRPRLPLTQIEEKMRKLWSHVLGIEPNSFDSNLSFFRLGGDSLRAMKLVSEARKEGLRLTVADIFRHPTLAELTPLINASGLDSPCEIKAFSLIEGRDASEKQIRDEAANNCNVNANAIEDTFPCSPLQEGLISLSFKRQGDYIMQNVQELNEDVDEAKFQAAWDQVRQMIPILRTRIFQSRHFGLVQAVTSAKTNWTSSGHLGEYLQRDKSIPMGLGEPLSRYALIRGASEGEKRRWFVWTVHHAIYDGWTMPRIIDAVTRSYKGEALSVTPPFQGFIKYINSQSHERAETYWKSQLSGCDSVIFPSTPSTAKQLVADTVIKHQCLGLRKIKNTDITTSTLIRTAWSIVVSRYTGSDDIIFGATVTGRNAPIADIESILGPTIATVPVRVQLPEGNYNVSKLLQSVQQQAADMIPFEQTGLPAIAKMGSHAKHACKFQTLLVVQPANENLTGNEEFTLGEWQGHSKAQNFMTYGLTLEFLLGTNDVTITARFDKQAFENWQVIKILGQLSFVMQQLAEVNVDATIADIEITTPEDHKELWMWNREVPSSINRSIHDAIFQPTQTSQLDAPAICAWDGNLTYGELDRLSTKLAFHLINKFNVKVKDVIPLCFGKSMWTIVSMLAVVKAGAAFVPIDPEHPESRHSGIFEQTKARLILTSAEHSTHHSLHNYAAHSAMEDFRIFAVCEASVAQIPSRKGVPCPNLRPDEMAYIMFTSGSTGVPKGVVLEHQAVSTGCSTHGSAFGFGPGTRVLQFASYTFDACIAEIISTLLCGGCVCVPSEDDKEGNLAGTIRVMGITHAILTPSVARLLAPDDVPDLQVLVLAGEQVGLSDMKKWEGLVQVINGYGPTECCVCSALHINKGTSSPGVIGKSVASVSWVADPDDYRKLAPLGSVGELLVEGPILARGYFNDLAKTESAFVTNPGWLVGKSKNRAGREGRLYKTGDLVRYQADGSLVYLGRKDSQRKVRGQRVELGEIEHCVRECLPTTRLAVEIVEPGEEKEKAVIAVFIESGATEEGLRTESSPPEVIFPVEVHREVSNHLPSYMVPRVYFSVARLPISTSGKIDRRILRQLGASFTAQQLASLQTQMKRSKRYPSTEIERKLQEMVARVLNLHLEDIGMDDNFLELGGDSIMAMKLVGEARKDGVTLSVGDIFNSSDCGSLSKFFQSSPIEVSQPPPAFSLIPGSAEEIFSDLNQGETPIHPNEVEDILPLSPIQRSIVQNAIDDSRRAFNYFFLDIGLDLDTQRLQQSLHDLLSHYSILRSRFVSLQGSLWQVVFRHVEPSFHVQEVDVPLSEASYALCLQDTEKADPDGFPVHFVLLRHTPSSTYRMILRISHAQYDGVSFPIIMRSLENSYNRVPMQLPSLGFNTYLKYIRKIQPDTLQYWRNTLEGSSMTNFPANFQPRDKSGAIRRSEIESVVPLPRISRSSTAASLVSCAWIIVLSHITNARDIIYGTLVAGRNANISGITEMIGPCINTVPIRVQITPSSSAADIVHSVQNQMIAMGEADSVDFQDICRECTDWPADTKFGSVLQYQNIDEHPRISLGGDATEIGYFENPFAVPRTVQILVSPSADRLKIKLVASNHILDAESAKLLLAMLCRMIEILASGLQVSIAQCSSILEESTADIN